MATAIQVNLVDRSNERTSVRIPVSPAGAANYEFLQLFETSLQESVEALSLLSVTGSSINTASKESYTLPADVNANREMAVRFVMEDANANQMAFSLGGPDLSEFPFVAGEGGDIFEWGSAPAGTALTGFVAEVSAAARHPISGAAVTVKRLELIGRNN